MEKNILIKSDKLNLKKIFILSWTVVFFITCIALVTTIKQYSNYKKCQNIIVNTLIASDSKFEKYDNNKEKYELCIATLILIIILLKLEMKQ